MLRFCAVGHVGVTELGFLELTDFISLSMFVIMLVSSLKQTTIST